MTTAIEPITYHIVTFRLFGDARVIVANVPDGFFYPVPQVTRALGLAVRAQVERVRNDKDLAQFRRDIGIPTRRGPRETTCLHRMGLAPWIGDLDVARVRADIRERLRSLRKAARMEMAREEVRELILAQLYEAADRIRFGEVDPIIDTTGTQVVEVSAPVRGEIHHECPNCGAPLCIVLDAQGVRVINGYPADGVQHPTHFPLLADPDDQDDE
jgi:hypothetical protein